MLPAQPMPASTKGSMKNLGMKYAACTYRLGFPIEPPIQRRVLVKDDGILSSDPDMVEDDIPAEAAARASGPQGVRGLIEGWGKL